VQRDVKKGSSGEGRRSLTQGTEMPGLGEDQLVSRVEDRRQHGVHILIFPHPNKDPQFIMWRRIEAPEVGHEELHARAVVAPVNDHSEGPFVEGYGSSLVVAFVKRVKHKGFHPTERWESGWVGGGRREGPAGPEESLDSSVGNFEVVADWESEGKVLLLNSKAIVMDDRWRRGGGGGGEVQDRIAWETFILHDLHDRGLQGLGDEDMATRLDYSYQHLGEGHTSEPGEREATSPALCHAISSTVLPRRAWWSKLTLVITVANGFSMKFVESNLPPSPASRTT
jgi:hypothetical protein